ncbi:hypothetical protein ALP33_200020 [Pseudomonas amygdali pv. lachrymans]|uniref:Uncharacterized protein n=1 Tax=Pseudomonas amygdali pv. lachrymans TaxID=53707 RepID=A0AB37R2N8_PSEAV|nr:hypothetical protein ALQ26_200032 [Pseudomonas amygdali pv. lachrymans]RMU18114.1 hypothetical protein ALP33_200020 [Pseudomonas amygdali pv. lachrymans]
MSLIDDHHCEAASVPHKIAQTFVVDDDPACLRIECLQGNLSLWKHHQDLALPVDDQAVEHNHQNGFALCTDTGGNHRLARFAQPHVVGQQCAGAL